MLDVSTADNATNLTKPLPHYLLVGSLVTDVNQPSRKSDFSSQGGHGCGMGRLYYIVGTVNLHGGRRKSDKKRPRANLALNTKSAVVSLRCNKHAQGKNRKREFPRISQKAPDFRERSPNLLRAPMR